MAQSQALCHPWYCGRGRLMSGGGIQVRPEEEATWDPYDFGPLAPCLYAGAVNECGDPSGGVGRCMMQAATEGADAMRCITHGETGPTRALASRTEDHEPAVLGPVREAARDSHRHTGTSAIAMRHHVLALAKHRLLSAGWDSCPPHLEPRAVLEDVLVRGPPISQATQPGTSCNRPTCSPSTSPGRFERFAYTACAPTGVLRLPNHAGVVDSGGDDDSCVHAEYSCLHSREDNALTEARRNESVTADLEEGLVIASHLSKGRVVGSKLVTPERLPAISTIFVIYPSINQVVVRRACPPPSTCLMPITRFYMNKATIWLDLAINPRK
ncbi:hypothetical protein Micbo1qcDRAFT_178195 [Microdochium bolleyi]|uniref:Uncharacterized protein n=1 Tax=Microdochium bolleyi TaxID=196109 RepID=A0A136IUS4_9PEZI|nr:hypothetical protein Micbo1qcDRAFT_178195 [Microdochium bolleyi]